MTVVPGLGCLRTPIMENPVLKASLNYIARKNLSEKKKKEKKKTEGKKRKVCNDWLLFFLIKVHRSSNFKNYPKWLPV